MSNGYLALEDGTVFPARSVAAPGVAFGEAVFTTAMTGYQETVTDPSYAGQLVCFTAPMVGNYGVADERLESGRPWANAALMRHCGGEEWAAWLALHGIESRIQRFTLQDETWYRVRIGPIGTVEELDAVRAKLAEAEVEATAVSSQVVETPPP